MGNAICWFRYDLRVHDNETLVRAADYGPVLPVYCFDPRHYRRLPQGFRKTDGKRVKFLFESLLDLRMRLGALGAGLLVVQGKPEDVLPELCARYGVDRIFAQREITREETDVETAVGARAGAELELVWGRTLYHPNDAPFEPNKAPLTFKTFRTKLTDAAEVRPVVEPPDRLEPVAPEVDYGNLPSYSELGFAEAELVHLETTAFRGGETAALERLDYYTFQTQLLNNYKFTRNRSLGPDYSSKFSAWMAVGCLSPREIYWTVKRYEQEVKKNISTWWLIFEMLWRDYFQWMGLRHGDRIFFPSGIKNRDVEWQHDPALFDRWCRGETGVPFVDAHLRELRQTGFMSNRGRVNCASFLSRDYQIDWTWGAAWFESHLLDYDVCSNWLNWNTQATDYYYTNPLNQGLRYDTGGEYVRTWLPELAALPGPLVHAPWLAEGGVPEGYPEPAEIYPKWSRAQTTIRKVADGEPLPKRRSRRRKKTTQ